MTKTIPCPGCGGGGCSICQTCKGKGTIERYSIDYKTLPISYEAQLKLFKKNVANEIVLKLLKELNDIVLKENSKGG